MLKSGEAVSKVRKTVEKIFYLLFKHWNKKCFIYLEYGVFSRF